MFNASSKTHASKHESIMPKIIIRQADQQELKMIMNWAAQEGWNPGKYDYISYFSMGPNAYLLLCYDDKPVGSISLVQYSKELAFIGLFIIDPIYRSQGLGKMLWQEALKRLEYCATIGLYAVPAQVSRYCTAGFKEGYLNQRWSKKIILDSPITNTFSMIFAAYFSLEYVADADTIAMFKGEEPEDKGENCYGLASLEIG